MNISKGDDGLGKEEQAAQKNPVLECPTADKVKNFMLDLFHLKLPLINDYMYAQMVILNCLSTFGTNVYEHMVLSESKQQSLFYCSFVLHKKSDVNW